MAVEKERVYLDSNGNELLRVQNGADADNVDFDPGDSGMESTNAEDAIKEAYNHGGGGGQISLDDTVTSSSQNGVKSSGIYAYIQQTVAATGAIIGEYVDYDGITFNLLSKRIKFYGGRIVVGKTVIGASEQTIDMLEYNGANRRVAIFYDGGLFKLRYVEQLANSDLSASAIFIGAYTYYLGAGHGYDTIKTYGLSNVSVIPERDKDTWPRLIKTFDFNEPIMFEEVDGALTLMKEDLGMASTDTLTASPISLTVPRIYELYDNFVADYPNLVTKTAWGSTNNENYELSYYVIGDDQANFDHKGALGRTPTIIIGTGVHGSERASVLGTYFFIRHVLKSSDAWAKFIRRNIRIVLLPMINPYGWVHTSRGNGTVTDVNRNFNVYITNGFTEKETQLCKAVLDAFPRAACLIDYHGSDSIGYVHSYTNGSKLASIWYSVASELDSLWKETYATDISTFINNGGTFRSNLNGKFIHGADNTDVKDDFSDYGDVVGIPSTTLETVLTMPWETTGLTTACLRCTTQTLAYFVLNLFV